MRVTSSTQLRRNLSTELDRVRIGRETIVVYKNGRPAAVMLPFESHFDHAETAYLLGTQANAERLLRSTAEFESNNLLEVEWDSGGNLRRTDTK